MWSPHAHTSRGRDVVHWLRGDDPRQCVMAPFEGNRQLEESYWHCGFPECQCLVLVSVMLEAQHLHVKFMHIENLWLPTGRCSTTSSRSTFEVVGLSHFAALHCHDQPRRFLLSVACPSSQADRRAGFFNGVEHRIFRGCTDSSVVCS